jgi:hypothetical protein
MGKLKRANMTVPSRESKEGRLPHAHHLFQWQHAAVAPFIINTPHDLFQHALR